MSKLLVLLAVIALGAYIAIGIYSNWQTALAIFILVWMNNIAKSEDL